MLNHNLENNVRARRIKENHPEPLAYTVESIWKGKGRRDGRFLVIHIEKPGQFYLRLRPTRTDEHGYPVAIKSKWLRDGVEVDQTELAEFLPKPSRSPKQELTKAVPHRIYKIENIKSRTFHGSESGEGR